MGSRAQAIRERQRAYKPGSLTEQQKRFVEEVLAGEKFDLGAAALRAGYKHKSVATKLLAKHQVATALGKGIRERSIRMQVTADQVLSHLACIAFFNPKRLLDAEGKLIPLKDLPDEVAICLQSLKVSIKEEDGADGVEVVEVRESDLKFWDKLGALDSLAKHLGLFAPLQHQIQHSVSIDWDGLYKDMRTAVDQVEQRIIDVESAPVLGANGHEH